MNFDYVLKKSRFNLASDYNIEDFYRLCQTWKLLSKEVKG